MSDDNVVSFTGITRLDGDPERILKAAMKAGLEGVVILGYDADGAEYFASSYAGGPDVLWLLERCKIALLDAVGDE